MYKSRILKEAQQASKPSDSCIHLSMCPENIFKWDAYLSGPPDSPFRHSYFYLQVTLDSEYPVKAPKIRFVTRIFHPNVHWETGEICLEALQDQWSPIWTLESLCRAILFLMSNPNAESPLNCDAGNMVRNGDLIAYDSMASMYSIEYGISKNKITL